MSDGDGGSGGLMLGQREQLAVLLVVAAILFGLGYKYALLKKTDADPPPAVEKAVDTAAAELKVHVVGAVESPGVYSLARGSRVGDAISEAGPRPEADLNALNLAAILQDGQRIRVPETPPPAAEGEQTPALPGIGADGKININTADGRQLEGLPGIGPALAERIIRYREENGPFGMVEDLMNVSGIGEKKLEGLIDHATTY